MNDVDKLLSEFVDSLNAGEAPQAADFIARAVTDEQRVALAEGIEAVLSFVPDEIRHPRGEGGAFVLGLPAERLAEVTRVTWPEAIPFWREEANLTLDQLAVDTLRAGGFEENQANVGAAGRWLAAMEAGAETVRSVSAKAMDAVADALGVARERFSAAGDFEQRGAVAFRAQKVCPDEAAADRLLVVADEIDAAMTPDGPGSGVDNWFSVRAED